MTLNQSNFRLICLWAFCECGIGGLMHAFKIPFTGLIVGGLATVIVTLLAYTNPKKEIILTALSLVLCAKAVLSPQSPLPAYLAVSFQGVLGYILYKILTTNLVSAILFATIALLESALQKYIVLVFFFGQNWLLAFDKYIDGLLQQFNMVNKSGNSHFISLLFAFYIFIYIVLGIFWGHYATRIIAKIKQGNYELPKAFYLSLRLENLRQNTFTSPIKRKKYAILLAVTVLFALTILCTNQYRYLLVILISVVIYLFILPNLSKWLNKYLQNRAQKNEITVAIMQEITFLTKIATYYWEKSNMNPNKIQRMMLFLDNLILTTLLYDTAKIQNNVFILCAPIHTGKTTALKHIIDQKKYPIYGIICPVENNQKILLDAFTLLKYEFEVNNAPNIKEVESVGKYLLSKQSFSIAHEILLNTIPKTNSCIVIDEIGKLEMEKKGFYPALNDIFENLNNTNTYIFVVRDSLLSSVIAYFDLKNHEVLGIKDMTEI